MTDNPKDAERLAEQVCRERGSTEFVSAIEYVNKTCGPAIRDSIVEEITRLREERDESEANLAHAIHQGANARRERDAARDYATEQAGYRLAAEDKAADLERQLTDLAQALIDNRQEIGDLERRLAEARTDFLDCALYDATMEGPAFKGFNRSSLDRLRRKYEAALAEAEAANEQLRRDVRISPEAANSPCSAPQPTADHTERAREAPMEEASRIWYGRITPWATVHARIEELATVLHETRIAAERAGAEKMRALDEAVVEAARRAKDSMGLLIAELKDPGTEALASWYMLGHALAARDAALTEGEK